MSIVTICRDAAATIEATLRSVAEQNYSNIEHIVVDGASNDGTIDIVRNFAHVAKFISEPDAGIYGAMNKGLRLCSGDFVLFLNADDWLISRTTVEDAVSAILGSPGADVYYGWLEVRRLGDDPAIFKPPAPDDVPEFMITGCLPHQSTFARRSVFDRTGPFDLRYRYHADYDWYLKALADPDIRFAALDLAIGSFAMGGHSSQLQEGQPEVFAIQNSAQLFSGARWDHRRIAKLQEAMLFYRVEAERLKQELNWVQNRSSGRAPEFPRVVAMQTVDFSKQANQRYLHSGWSSSECWGVWSGARNPTLAFSISEPLHTGATLHLRVTPYFGKKLWQVAWVRVNGRRAGAWWFIRGSN